MKLFNVLMIISFLTLPFSKSAFALIIEGTYSGTTSWFLNENMHVTPDAEFWHENENQYEAFTGTFWYDTDKIHATTDPWNPNLVMYVSERDSVHSTLIGANGASVELTSRGTLPSFSKKPKDSIYIQRQAEGYPYTDRISMSYGDYGKSPSHGITGPHREGGLLISSNTPILDGFGLIQHFEFSSELNGNKPIGSVHLKTKGVLDGVAYEGEFWGEIDKFEIHVRNSVPVPEPSSLILFLLPLAFLGLRRQLISAP